MACYTSRTYEEQRAIQRLWEAGVQRSMSNFEKIMEAPEVLGEFLTSLTIADGPFHRAFCDRCPAENCDEENCPHDAERNNPTWWLKLREKPGE